MLFFTFTGGGDRDDESALAAERMAEVRAAAESAAADAGAVLLGSSNPELGDYARRLKQLLDPDHIMNPGL